jgi:homoserine O-acetyltransferase
MKTAEGIFECGDLGLQRGGTLKTARIVYKTFGTLSPRRDNVILYPTSYSAQHSDIEWLVAPTHALDPSRYFIVIPNMFTNGLSTSPSNYAGEFPQITTYDNVTQQRRLLAEVFGVDRVKLVYGWSMGAQQAYHWGALFGEAVERIVVNCGSARTAPHNFVFLEGVRSALEAARTPQDGLRAMGRIYAGWALSQTFYRRELWRELGFTSLEDFLVRSWEAGFLRRDMRDLLAQLWTWQAGDISANDLYRGDLAMALSGIKAKVLLMPSATDLYFQTDDNRAELPHLKSARLVEIPSVWGHRAGNPRDNPADAAFIDAQVTALLES